jgi:hypothetical protein
MSRRRRDETPGHARLLDAWTPPPGAGEALGCVATSYTFSPVFFEEECLGRFVGLETDAAEDGAAFLVEREEKFAQLVCAAALVDQRHARGLRSLRWDLLAVRLLQGIQHSKVSLLLWTGAARLIIASANLTEDGYRRNHEVFGVLDFAPGSGAPLPALHGTLDFLAAAVRFADPAEASAGPAARRWLAFLDRVRAATQAWGVEEPARGATVRVAVAFTGPGRPSLLDQVRERWPAATPPESAWVVSPFFDPPEAVNAPAQAVWPLLRRRGRVSVCYAVTAEDDAADGAVLLHAPESLRWAPPGREDAVRFERLKADEHRPLHAKCLWLEGPEWLLYACGSSNWTSAGLGVGKVKNLEANLVYAVHHARDPEARNACDAAWLGHAPILQPTRFLPQPCTDEDAPCGDELLLPAAFGTATLARQGDGALALELTFHGEPPDGWIARAEEEDETLASDAAWREAEQPAMLRVPWPEERRPPAALRVSWKGAAGSAWWPVNIRDGAALPPPAELRALPLDVLADLLTSAQPLHLALARWLRQRAEAPATDGAPLLDPHRRVDTSQFLLQRTRRVSWALAGLRARLERPAASHEALVWRLRGPVGALALADAIRREARSEDERAFLLAELLLELARVRPSTMPGGVSAQQAKAAVRALIAELRARLAEEIGAVSPTLRTYLKTAASALP